MAVIEIKGKTQDVPRLVVDQGVKGGDVVYLKDGYGVKTRMKQMNDLNG